MRILFYDGGPLDYTPQTPFDRPLGGTESAVAYLSAALAARGHDVVLINRSAHRGDVRGVKVNPAKPTAAFLNTADAVVSLSRSNGAYLRRRGVTAPLVCWQHRSVFYPRIGDHAERQERAAWTATAFVSDHQRLAFKSRFGIDGPVLRNAASPAALALPLAEDCFLDRGDDPALIYASAPGRGLNVLLTAFPLIRQALPGASLRVCSGGAMYQLEETASPFAELYALARATPGVELAGGVSQPELALELSRADILAYPTAFVETACIVAMEAAVAGCLFAGTDIGALRETLNGYGAFMPLDPSLAAFSRQFADLVIGEVRTARAGPEAFKQRRREQAQTFRATHSWDRRAAEWEAFLEALPH